MLQITYENLNDFQDWAKKKNVDKIFFQTLVIPNEQGLISVVLRLTSFHQPKGLANDLKANPDPPELLVYADRVVTNAEVKTIDQQDAIRRAIQEKRGAIINDLNKMNDHAKIIEGAISYANNNANL
jgi:hypothetical protein